MVEIQYCEWSGACLIRLSGDMDTLAVPGLRDAVQEALARGCRALVMDLTDVTYVDSSAIGFLIWADRLLRPVAGRLVLAGASPDVTRIIELSGLVDVAPSVSASATIEDALLGTEPWPDARDAEAVSTLTFPADACAMSDARGRVEALVAPCGLSPSAQFDLKVAVGEALANAVRHGSPRGGTDAVSVRVLAYADRVVVEVGDTGSGYGGHSPGQPDVYAVGGRGVLLMRALADRVEFVRNGSGGTLVRLAKRINA